MIEIKQLNKEQKDQLSIKDWPIWEKEISEFEWYYHETEECLILEGEVIVVIKGIEYHIKEGDFVTFQKGLECYWKILEPIRKYYRFV